MVVNSFLTLLFGLTTGLLTIEIRQSGHCVFTGVESYDSYDVLEDVEFKEGMKRFS